MEQAKQSMEATRRRSQILINPSREEMKKMMNEMQDELMIRQQEMFEDFFQRMGQETARAVGIQNKRPKRNAGAYEDRAN